MFLRSPNFWGNPIWISTPFPVSCDTVTNANSWSDLVSVTTASSDHVSRHVTVKQQFPVGHRIICGLDCGQTTGSGTNQCSHVELLLAGAFYKHRTGPWPSPPLHILWVGFSVNDKHTRSTHLGPCYRLRKTHVCVCRSQGPLIMSLVFTMSHVTDGFPHLQNIIGAGCISSKLL